MIKRRPKAAVRFQRRVIVPSLKLSGRDFQTLKKINRGAYGQEADRLRLVSMGLLTSKIATRCVLTIRGMEELEAGIRVRAIAPIDARSGETVGLDHEVAKAGSAPNRGAKKNAQKCG